MFSAIRARLRLRSVRARLTFWYLLTLGASLGAFAAFVFAMRANSLYTELDDDLEVRAHRLAAELRPALFALDPASALSADSRLATVPLVVRDASGVVVFRSAAFPPVGWRGERQAATAARERQARTVLVDLAGVSLHIATIAVPRPGTDPLVLQAASSAASVRQALDELAATMLLAIVAVLAVASYGSGFTARRALAPVDEIVARVRHIQAEGPGLRLDIEAGSAELDRLVLTLNGMLDRIEASVTSARRFAADASHELQTPVAAMRAAIETGLHTDVDPRVRGLAGELLEEIDTLSALIRDLRLLALADAGRLVEGREAFDLAALAGDCVEIARAMADDKRIEVDLDARDRPVVVGSSLHLRRALLNLAQNAIRYSPPLSTIAVSVAASASEAVVEVVDQGCGIAASDLPHIFEPFYRADPARARETGGTGLGLAIADQIVRAHGGRIDVSSALGHGSIFTARLPLATPPSRPPAARVAAETA